VVIWGIATAAAAQTPTPTPSPIPQIADDEKDFLGLTSLALGSGARAFGMGGAFLARADDATAASWNPAGLSYLRRPEVTVVGARNSFVRRPTVAGATRLIDDRFAGNTLDFAAATYPIQMGPASGAVQLSFQRVFSFRGERRVERTDQLLSSDGHGGFDVLAFATGFHAVRTLRVGATLNRWVNGYSQVRIRRAPRGDTIQNLDLRLTGWNFNAGVIWSPTESFNLGVVGKSVMKGSVNLDRRRRDDIPQPRPSPPVTTYNAANDEALRSEDNPREHPIDVSLSIPGAVGFGASWQPRSVLTVSADYTRTFWSIGRIHNFFTLARTEVDPSTGEPSEQGPPARVFPSLRYPTLDDLRQADTEQFRLGAEYVILGQRVKLPLRAGFFTDKQYFFDFRGRPPRFLGYTVGLGVVAGPVLLDVAYLRETGRYLDPEADPDDPAATGAERSTRFNRLFVSIIYRHGTGP